MDKRYPIERGSDAPLRLAEISVSPRAMWFWTARTYTYGAASEHAAGTRLLQLTDTIRFVLSVYNVDADQTLVADATVLLNERGVVTSFTLTKRRSVD